MGIVLCESCCGFVLVNPESSTVVRNRQVPVLSCVLLVFSSQSISLSQLTYYSVSFVTRVVKPSLLPTSLVIATLAHASARVVA